MKMDRSFQSRSSSGWDLYRKEIYAPDGFVTSNEEKEFTFEYGKPEEAEVSYELF